MRLGYIDFSYEEKVGMEGDIYVFQRKSIYTKKVHQASLLLPSPVTTLQLWANNPMMDANKFSERWNGQQFFFLSIYSILLFLIRLNHCTVIIGFVAHHSIKDFWDILWSNGTIMGLNSKIQSKREFLFSILINVWRFASSPLHINDMIKMTLSDSLSQHFFHPWGMRKPYLAVGLFFFTKSSFLTWYIGESDTDRKNKYFPIFLPGTMRKKHFSDGTMRIHIFQMAQWWQTFSGCYPICHSSSATKMKSPQEVTHFQQTCFSELEISKQQNNNRIHIAPSPVKKFLEFHVRFFWPGPLWSFMRQGQLNQASIC